MGLFFYMNGGWVKPVDWRHQQRCPVAAIFLGSLGDGAKSWRFFKRNDNAPFYLPALV